MLWSFQTGKFVKNHVAQSWECAEPLACGVSLKTVIFLLGAVISVYIQRDFNSVLCYTRLIIFYLLVHFKKIAITIFSENNRIPKLVHFMVFSVSADYYVCLHWIFIRALINVYLSVAFF